MKVKCLGTDRNMILRVMEAELGAAAVYCPSPDFSYIVGSCKLGRDGYIEAYDGDDGVFTALASLGLCDYPYESPIPDDGVITYSTEGHNGVSLINLMCIISARQRLLNQAIDARGAFYVAEGLVSDLLAHPPETIYNILQALYGRDDEYSGIILRRDYICFTGFEKGHPEESHIHRQLADHIVASALSRGWIKPFTASVRNRKYAFRIWMNSIGMTGPEYEDARTILLERLYGRSDQRIIPRGKERG